MYFACKWHRFSFEALFLIVLLIFWAFFSLFFFQKSLHKTKLPCLYVLIFLIWDLTRVGLIECRDNISVSLDEINYAEGLSISQMEAEEEYEGLGWKSLAFMKSVSLKILLRSNRFVLLFLTVGL